jgi:AraC-type transcriptional regulator N-terminus
VIEYHAGDCLVVTASVPLSGQFIDARPDHPALAIGLRLRFSAIAASLPDLPHDPIARRGAERAVGTTRADRNLLDATLRLLRLLDHPSDARVWRR